MLLTSETVNLYLSHLDIFIEWKSSSMLSHPLTGANARQKKKLLLNFTSISISL